MDELPDEVLLQILQDSYDHPFEILSKLSLVCKRWWYLCREKECWSKAELSLSCSDPLESFLENATTLTKAPHVLALTVVCNTDGRNKTNLIRCLELSFERNMKIKKLCVELSEQDILFHLFEFIKHNAMSSLLMLTLTFNARTWLSSPKRFKKDNTIGSCFEMILRMKTLKSLEISLIGCVFFETDTQSRFISPLEILRLHASEIFLNPSLAIFANNVMSHSLQTLKRLHLNVRFPGEWYVPDICFPNVGSVELGFLDNPNRFKREFFPNLADISFQWMMGRTANIGECVINVLDRFKDVFVKCKVVMFGRQIQGFNEQQVRDYIFSVHSPEKCDLTFELHG